MQSSKNCKNLESLVQQNFFPLRYVCHNIKLQHFSQVSLIEWSTFTVTALLESIEYKTSNFSELPILKTFTAYLNKILLSGCNPTVTANFFTV